MPGNQTEGPTAHEANYNLIAAALATASATMLTLLATLETTGSVLGSVPLKLLLEAQLLTVEVALILHQGRTRKIVEVLDAAVGEVGLEPLHQRQIFLQGDGYFGRLQVMEKARKHRVGPIVARGFARCPCKVS